jgi:hypothetical protein
VKDAHLLDGTEEADAVAMAMVGLDRQQLVGAAVLLITAAFMGSRWVKRPHGAWWRRAVIVSYFAAIGLVLVWVAAWLLGG